LVDLVVGLDLTRLAKALVDLSGMMVVVLVGLEPKLEALVGISLVSMQVLVLMGLELRVVSVVRLELEECWMELHWGKPQMIEVRWILAP
jgi:hypothetical protein